jgi:F-type H+-transporting ATP synthase subunit e
VARYSALVAGIFYGIAHRRTLQKAHDEEKIHHAIHDREHLIEQAKAAWKKQQESSKGGGTSIHPLLVINLARTFHAHGM